MFAYMKGVASASVQVADKIIAQVKPDDADFVALRDQIAQNERGQADAATARSSLAQELTAAVQTVRLLSEQLAPREDESERASLALSEARAVCAAAEAEERGLAARFADAAQQQKRAQDRLVGVQEAIRTLEVLDPTALSGILAQQTEAKALAEQAAAALAQAQAAIQVAEQTVQQQRQAEAGARRESDQLAAELTAQQAGLKRLEAPGAMGPWLQENRLTGRPALWSGLQVEAGWQQAVGAVLAERLSALGLERLEEVESIAVQRPPATQFFYGGGPSAGGDPLNRPADLANKVSGPDEIAALARSWLTGAVSAEGLGPALARRASLSSGEFFVTPEGHQVGVNWVRLHGNAADDGSSLIAQRDLVDDLRRRSQAAVIRRDEAAAVLASAEQRLEGLKRQLVGQRETEARARSRAHELEVMAVRIQEKAERLQQRAQELESSRLALTQEELRAAEQLRTLQSVRDAAQQALAAGQAQRTAAQEDAQAAQSAWSEARQSLARAQEVQKSLELQERSLQERSARLGAEHASLQARVAECQARIERSQSEAGQVQVRLAESGLQALLEERVACEAALSAARDAADGVGQTVRTQDETRLRLEREAIPLAEQSAQADAAMAGARATIEQIDQQVQDLGLEVQRISEGWPASEMPQQQPKPATVATEVSRLMREIEALGAVNLAALQELEQATERQGFLVAQATDLLSAVETLEDAIRKIDRESRALLQSTYDTVNSNFARLFPTLFGGGEARLVLTGEEILDAGVQVMAQPPGKKNSSIHLLSGGEKALTATALVFALFQLNPAPFCLLDEVDAPLDDPNTERLCRLVREMSAATQFIFITHNKIAMELAEHLVGVTMQEQGVSRLVAVDLETQVA
ncbi:MAG: hypothetical protein EBR88_03770 [Betaproteobacteria bacterium]|nr:hypothetical protein [Betaproteobacteria bacterium]